MVANHCAALDAVAGPVITRPAGSDPAVCCRPRKNVVHVGYVTSPIDHMTFLGKASLFVDPVGSAVQLVEVAGDQDTFHIVPRTRSNPVSGVRRGLAA